MGDCKISEFLRTEILNIADKRHNYTINKLNFITVGVGISLSTIFTGTKNISPYLLFALPFIAYAYDLFIINEIQKGLRISIFFRKKHIDNNESCNSLVEWELFVEKYRTIIANSAHTFLNLFVLLFVFVISHTIDTIKLFKSVEMVYFYWIFNIFLLCIFAYLYRYPLGEGKLAKYSKEKS